jgi:uncharacterized protein YjbJ (UPF0337 family)
VESAPVEDDVGTNLAQRQLGASVAAKSCHTKKLPEKEFAMDWNRIEGNWKQFKGKIKEQWGHLTDDDLEKVAGRREQLEGKIQEHYGISKDAARKDVDDWMKRQQ